MSRGNATAPLHASAAALPFIAHQGGWDELALFGIPVILAIVAVRIAEKRARAKREDGAEHATSDRDQ